MAVKKKVRKFEKLYLDPAESHHLFLFECNAGIPAFSAEKSGLPR
jgi:hypothetical protein